MSVEPETRNVELLRPVYAEWARGNFRPQSDAYDANLEWGWSDEFPGLGGVAQELGPRSERLERWLSSWEHGRVEAEDFIAAGSSVVVICRYIGRGRESGVDVDRREAHLWTFRDGRAVRLEVFSDPDRALAAGGVEPERYAGS